MDSIIEKITIFDKNKVTCDLFNMLAAISMSFNKRIIGLTTIPYPVYYDSDTDSNYDKFVELSIKYFNEEIAQFHYERLLVGYLGAIFYNYTQDSRFLIEDKEIDKVNLISTAIDTFLPKLQVYPGMPRYPYIYIDADGKHNDLMKRLYLNFPSSKFDKIPADNVKKYAGTDYDLKLKDWDEVDSIKTIPQSQNIYLPMNGTTWKLEDKEMSYIGRKKQIMGMSGYKALTIPALIDLYQDDIYTGFKRKGVFKGMKIIRPPNYIKEIVKDYGPGKIAYIKRKYDAADAFIAAKIKFPGLQSFLKRIAFELQPVAPYGSKSVQNNLRFMEKFYEQFSEIDNDDLPKEKKTIDELLKI